MNSFERVMTAISHKEPDQVPLFLLLSLYGAKELGLPVKEYFSDPQNVIEAQLRMREKYSNDCIYTFFHAPIEIEAFGGEVIYVEDGPPNTGEPFIKSFEQIDTLVAPKIEDCKGLIRVLEATTALKSKTGGEVPLIGVVMSPFSVPVMQLGFEKYLELLYFYPDKFDKLMQINEDFCVSWANAQLDAGATAICYFDPLASPNMIERKKYLDTGNIVAKRTIGCIKGPTATHLASGIALPVVDDIVSSGSAVIGFSANDDITEIKNATKNKICLLGNLNTVEMVHWNNEKVISEVKNVIANAGKGGGLILAENHGEIPWQVPENVLLEISQAVKEFGRYPLSWVENK